MAATIDAGVCAVSNILYQPWFVPLLLIAGGIYLTVRCGFMQVGMFREACRVIVEKPHEGGISSFGALMVSTASRVGTGNIIGVSTAIILGGPGAIFWMWITAFFGGASAFVESTLAQIFKKRDDDGSFKGGPAFYMRDALGQKWLGVIFSILIIFTYMVGYNMLASYNLQSTFAVYSFYQESTTPMVVGAVLAVLVGYCLLGGGKRIVKLTSVIVPFMGISYVVISMIVILFHITNIPVMFVEIFKDAFDFKAIFGGVAGSCLIYGIKRGLYSNEAGVGSAPNASASAHVTHPVKQGLVQTLSVYIDTLLLCTATALMCLSSGVEHTEAVSGALYVQNAISTVFGRVGPLFITIAMVLFAFTTLLGNLYYVDNALIFMNNKKEPSKKFKLIFKLFCVIVVFLGAIIPMDAAWAMADITMGGMTLINLPACMLLGGVAIRALRDYEKQKKAGKNPVFRGSDIGLDEEELEYWNE